MIGIIVELLLSLGLLRLVEHRGLSALGLRPTRRRMLVFLGGLLVPVAIESGYYLLESVLVRNPYHPNPLYGWKDLGLLSRYLFNSVAFEDLAFRGAILYILIRRLGPRRGVWLSAVAFGIYHWFSFGVFGQVGNMIFVFIITTAAGYAFARAYERTGSMWLGAALHFSTDWVGMGLFGAKNALFVKGFASNPVQLGTWGSLGMTGMHLAVYVFLLLWYVRRVSSEEGIIFGYER